MTDIAKKHQASSNPSSAPSGAVLSKQQIEKVDRRRHRLACRMLRYAGKLDFDDLPVPRRTESVIDWLVRANLAPTHQEASEGLLLAAGLTQLRDQILADESSITL